jgi:hypothetical protein
MIALDRLQQIIPPDQALAMKALATSLQQIGGINNLNLPTLSVTVSGVETTKDLPLVTALTQAVPVATANYFINNLGDGTGENNNILITDILGTAAGWVSTDALIRTIALMSTMDLDNLTEIYEVMLDVVNGVYTEPDIMDPMMFVTTIPPGLPGAGTYGPTATANGSIDLAISTGLIPAAQAEIATLVSTYPEQTTELNQLWDSMADQVSLEQVLQAEASLVFADLTANQRTSIYGFIFSLPGYGLDIKVGGMSQFIEAVATLSTFAGQSIVACLRQGRNQQFLNSAGIITTTGIPADPEPPPADAVLIPSEYTEAEAANLVIK